MHFVLKPLPYAFDALEPYIDKQWKFIMVNTILAISIT